MPGAVSERGPSQDSASAQAGRGRERLDLFCERAIFGLVLAILVWSPVAMAAVRLIDFVPVEAMTALALGLWIVRFWTQRPFRLFWPPVCWFVYAFVLYALLRSPYVPIPYLAHRESMHVIVYAVLFLIIANNLNRREAAEIVTVTLIVLGTVLSLLAIYQFTTHSPLVSWLSWAHRPDQYLRRGSGSFINPDNFGGYIGMLIPLGLAYALVSRMSATAKVLLVYAVVVMAAGLCVSVSRGAIAATGLACIVLCALLLFQGGYLLPSLLTLIVIGGAALLVTNNMESVQRRFAKVEGMHVDDRQFYWEVADEVFYHHKMWGAGPAQFDQEFFLYRPERLQARIQYAHNDYLNTLADWGLAGLTLILAVLGAVFYGVRRAWRSVRRFTDVGRRRSDKGAFVLGAAFGLVVVALHCFIDFDMHVPANALLAVSLMALLAAHQRFVTERHWKNPGPGGKAALTLAAAAVAVLLVAQARALGNQQSWVEQAKAEKRFLDKPVDPDSPDYEALAYSPARQAAFARRIEDLKRAFAIDPTDASVSFDLAEAYWSIASDGARGYQQATLDAMNWCSRAIQANALDALEWIHYGVCLDWLDRHQEADRCFRQACSLDPNGWYVAFCEGRHLVEMDELPEARKYFMKAYVRIGGDLRTYRYIAMIDQRLQEAAKK